MSIRSSLLKIREVKSEKIMRGKSVGKISISAYCEKYNVTEEAVKAKINSGEVTGWFEQGVLYVEDNNLSRMQTPAACKKHEQSFIALSTLDFLPRREFIELGLVSGCSVQSVHLCTSVGMDSTRDDCLKKIQYQANTLTADAVLGIRFSTSAIH